MAKTVSDMFSDFEEKLRKKMQSDITNDVAFSLLNDDDVLWEAMVKRFGGKQKAGLVVLELLYQAIDSKGLQIERCDFNEDTEEVSYKKSSVWFSGDFDLNIGSDGDYVIGNPRGKK